MRIFLLYRLSADSHISLRDFCARTLEQKTQKPYDLIQDLLGAAASGRGDLSVRGEEILRERLGRKK